MRKKRILSVLLPAAALMVATAVLNAPYRRSQHREAAAASPDLHLLTPRRCALHRGRRRL